MGSMLLVYIVIYTFLLFLFIICSIIVSLYILKKPTEEEIAKNKVVNRMGMIVIPVSFAIVLTIVTVAIFIGAPLKQGEDITNWVTLIVEIGIGITIALVILIYSQFQGKRSIKDLSKQLQATQDTLISTMSTGSTHKIAISSNETT